MASIMELAWCGISLARLISNCQLLYHWNFLFSHVNGKHSRSLMELRSWVDNTDMYVNEPHTHTVYILEEATDGEDACWPTCEKKKITIIHMFSLGVMHMIILCTHFQGKITITRHIANSWLTRSPTGWCCEQLLQKPSFKNWTWLLLFRNLFWLLKIKPFCNVLSAVHISDYLMQLNVILNRVVNVEH